MSDEYFDEFENCDDGEFDEMAERANAADAVLYNEEYIAFFRDEHGEIVLSSQIRNDHLAEFLKPVFQLAQDINARIAELQVTQTVGKPSGKFRGH